MVEANHVAPFAHVAMPRWVARAIKPLTKHDQGPGLDPLKPLRMRAIQLCDGVGRACHGIGHGILVQELKAKRQQTCATVFVASVCSTILFAFATSSGVP